MDFRESYRQSSSRFGNQTLLRVRKITSYIHWFLFLCPKFYLVVKKRDLQVQRQEAAGFKKEKQRLLSRVIKMSRK